MIFVTLDMISFNSKAAVCLKINTNICMVTNFRVKIQQLLSLVIPQAAAQKTKLQFK